MKNATSLLLAITGTILITAGLSWYLTPDSADVAVSPQGTGCVSKPQRFANLDLSVQATVCQGKDAYLFRAIGNTLYIVRASKASNPVLNGTPVVDMFSKDESEGMLDAINRQFFANAISNDCAIESPAPGISKRENVYSFAIIAKHDADCGPYASGAGYFEYRPDNTRRRYAFIRPRFRQLIDLNSLQFGPLPNKP